MSRGRTPLLAWLVVTLVLCAVTAYLGWISATVEGGAPTAEPVAEAVLVPVEETELVDEMRLSCTATRPTVGALSDVRDEGVVSRVPEHGERMVRPGDLVAEVDGSPVVAVEGRVRMFRDIAPGDSGSDVDQLRAALALRGAVSSKEAGTPWGSDEQLAWSRHLAAAGYPKQDTKVVDRAHVLVADDLPAEAPWRTSALGAEDLSSLTLVSTTSVIGCPTPEGGRPVPRDAPVSVVGEEAQVSIVSVSPASTPEPGAGGADAETGPEGAEAEGDDSTQVLRLAAPSLDLDDGSSVLVSVELGRSDAEALVVPLAALRTDAAGETVVHVAGATGRDVQVAPGFSAHGLVQVAPSPTDALDPGDEVVVSGQGADPDEGSGSAPVEGR